MSGWTLACPVCRTSLEESRCPGCGRGHWYIGRIMAECAFCGTALPLENAALVAGGQIIRTVRRHPYASEFEPVH